MDLSDLEAEIALLLSRMENAPEDRFELFMQLRGKLNEMRAFGMPVPDDLRRVEAALEREFASEGAAAPTKRKARRSGGPSKAKSAGTGDS